MFGTSVSRLLMAVQITMLCGLLLAASTLAVGALRNFSDAGGAVADTESNRALFDAVVKNRAQIARVQTALVTQDDPRAITSKTRDEAKSAVAEAIGLLQNSDLAEKDDLLKVITTDLGAMDREWAKVEALFALAKGERNVATTDGWRRSVLTLSTALEKAATTLSSDMRERDALIGSLLTTREAAWRLRDNMGAQCSQLRPFVTESKPLTVDAARQWHVRRGAYGVDLQVLREIADRHGTPGALRDSIGLAATNIERAQATIDGLVARFDGSGQPAMEAAAYTSACNQPFESILAIAYGALDLSVDHAQSQRQSALLVLIATFLGLASAITLSLFGLFAIQRRLSQPTMVLREAIGHLSRQDYTTPVPPARHPDELGSIATALESLRRSAGEAQRLQQEAAERQTAELRRAEALRSYCREFEQAAQAALSTISAASGALDQTSGTMRHIASDTSAQAGMVSNAAEETSQNVQTVAAATEELSASIAEISHQVTASADMARTAAGQAASTNTTVEALTEAAQRIGDVVGLISEIAGQTNLLALNATIEAARAGEAGKGFAVVASEVKNLATQTARATEDITQQVQHIQMTTAEAVSAIQAITDMIRRISEGTSAIAAAVEEQGAATREISSSVQQVAQGTAEVTSTIAQLAQSSQQTGSAAQAVSEAVGDVVREQGSLRGAMENFLAKVQQA
jgi:methyl-accepting chemotaxis protein